ncbi:hypothetical protein L1987_73021 [Smallanthus sonchifolius]|uniref:Uncharacterized protein n=1 Tax=Smallanthus sonchifolius TaxID=185202 RepID=A0ACB9AVX6_9ASTR|nr:hypothetical protein L1987_73021 [Smallanthus sonchifolius]
MGGGTVAGGGEEMGGGTVAGGGEEMVAGGRGGGTVAGGGEEMVGGGGEETGGGTVAGGGEEMVGGGGEETGGGTVAGGGEEMVGDHDSGCKVALSWFSDLDLHTAQSQGLGEGAFVEHGPLKPKGDVLLKNNYSWNEEANMLYLETAE